MMKKHKKAVAVITVLMLLSLIWPLPPAVLPVPTIQ